jgi:fatty-acyl-CoA synthase
MTPPQPPAQSVGALLERAAATFPDRAALVAGDTSVTHAALREAAHRAARGLAALGVVKGTHVGILLPNSPEWLAFAFGAAALGGVLVPLSTLATGRELDHALRHADVSVLVTAERFRRHEYLATLLGLCPALARPAPDGLRSPEFPALRQVVVAGAESVPAGVRSAAACLAAAEGVAPGVVDAALARCVPADTAAIFFTSGSTALPKGVVHTHGSMLASAANIADALGLTADDVVWGCLPFFFTGGFVAIALATLCAGGTVVLQEAFEPGQALGLLERTGCTVVFGWPHQIQAMIERPDFDRARLRVRKGVGANAPWAASLYPPGHEAVGTYGMTESGPMSVATRWSDPLSLRARGHGRPMPGVELRIADLASGAPLPPGEQGEILLRGTTMMQGYYKMPRDTCFDAEGFFHTGDRGWIDRDGVLHFADRLKDVIKAAGVSVASGEIEAVLRDHPLVRAAWVVGVPDPLRGERPAAFVVAAGAVTTEDLLAFCRERLASYKVPRHVFWRREDELPVAGSGKVLKERLREQAIALTRDPT